MEKTVGGDRITKLMAANRGPRADRPKHEIVADAKAGRPGKLTVPFVSRAVKSRPARSGIPIAPR